MNISNSIPNSSIPLIPRSVLFGNPDKNGPRISPDGKQISYLAPVDGVVNVWVGPADKPEAARPVTCDTKRGIPAHYWTYDGHHLLYEQDREGDENWHIYLADLNSDSIWDLTPLEGAQARIQNISYLHPEEILVGINDRNPQLHDIYRINLYSGERTLLFQNDSYFALMADDHYQVRIGAKYAQNGGVELFKISLSGEPQLFRTIEPEDALSIQLLDFDKSGKLFYLIDSQDRNTAALRMLDLETGEYRVLGENSKADVLGILLHPTEKNVQAYYTYYERRQWHPLEATIAKDLETLRTVAEGDFTIVSRTLDDNVWIALFNVDNGPPRYYLYDRKSGRATFLFSCHRELENRTLAQLHPIIIKARDGLELVSYLTLPLEADPEGRGRPLSPVPLILWVHGGPWHRDGWGYISVHQWLANRGYAVLSVNFRGSTGFGKAFINASRREWGGKMHDDLVDAVDWAIKSGIADEKRAAIMGGSYGGYATLVGMTKTPEIFACGVDIVGPSNLITFIENMPAYWIPGMPLVKDRVGDHTTEEGRAFLLERSPLSHVNRINKPLLIAQGANDPRVPQRESDQIVKAMEEQKIPVTYLLYPDEGHGFARPENSISFWAVAEAFLARHLGGRYQPIEEDFKGSTIQAPAGADQVPELAEALARQV